MRILITSGGTKIPIDRVRDITNMSTGTFGAKIATEALLVGHQVVFLRARGSKSPFTIDKDLYTFGEFAKAEFSKKLQLLEHRGQSYEEHQYRNFEDYAKQLEALCRTKPDIVILAAAVSDYGVENWVDGKVRSDTAHLNIQLYPLPKLIFRVKNWAPFTYLVGFKLLVDSDDSTLVQAARDSIAKNRCDLVVANDLRDIKAGEHRIMLLEEVDGPVSMFNGDPHDPNLLARLIVDAAVKGKEARDK